MPLKNSLKQLNKKELLSIISKMKKEQLIDIINMHYLNQNSKISKKGGSTGEIIKETKNAIRKAIIFNQAKLYEENNNDSMNNNSIYNNV